MIATFPIAEMMAKETEEPHAGRCNMRIHVMVRRASKAKARWTIEQIMIGTAPGQLDPYFLQFRAAWSCAPLEDREAKRLAETLTKRERERLATN